jgi:hypothetical protein
MSDTKKPTDTSTEGAKQEGAKELDADQLENVAGGLLPAKVGVLDLKHKWIQDGVKIEIESQKIIGEDSLAPALKK